MRRDRTPWRSGRPRTLGGLVVAISLVTGCGAGRDDQIVPDATSRADASIDVERVVDPVSGSAEPSGPTADVSPGTTLAPSPTSTTTTSTTTTSTSTTTTSTTTTSTTTTTTTLPAPATPGDTNVDVAFSASNAAFDALARSNAGASITVVRGGEIVVSRASGLTIDSRPANGDTPMVVASVSKIVVAMGIARLAQQGRVDVDAPMPWADLGFDPHPGWRDVTVRELLDHSGGLATARSGWFTGDGDCRSYVSTLLVPPPSTDRGTWVYSNGNYCLLGLLVEQTTLLPLDAALQILVFDPIGVEGVHLTDGGLLPGDLAHSQGVERLSRLGGAGTLVVSTDDLAMMLGRATDADRSVLQPPGVFTDQYGWGHTGTITGAKSCVWVLEGGSTVVAMTIAGNSVASGGDVCDHVVPAVASDLGIGAGLPDRIP